VRICPQGCVTLKSCSEEDASRGKGASMPPLASIGACLTFLQLRGMAPGDKGSKELPLFVGGACLWLRMFISLEQ
jgi:hypothetical protein